MATNKPLIKSYVSQETYDKLKILAKKESRSVSNFIEVILEKTISEYETQHGNISIGDINISGSNISGGINIGNK